MKTKTTVPKQKAPAAKTTEIATARAKKGSSQPAATTPTVDEPAEVPQRELTPEEQEAQARMGQIQYELGGMAVQNAAHLLVQGSARMGESLIVPLDLQDQTGNRKAGYVVALFGDPEHVAKIAKVVGATVEGFRSAPPAPAETAAAKK